MAQTVVEKGIKIIHNGGGLNPKGLAQAIEEQLLSYGIDSLKVAYVEGDDVIGMIDTLKQSSELVHLDDASITLAAAQEDMLCANAYLGMGGIVAALDLGADIVICGRCCDASPVMGEFHRQRTVCSTTHQRYRCGRLVARMEVFKPERAFWLSYRWP